MRGIGGFVGCHRQVQSAEMRCLSRAILHFLPADATTIKPLMQPMMNVFIDMSDVAPCHDPGDERGQLLSPSCDAGAPQRS